MNEEMRTFGYLCPQCGKAVTAARSVFALEASNAEIECNCGESSLRVDFDGESYRLYVPCGLCGQIGVWTGWLSPSERALAEGAAAIAPTAFHWIGLILVCFVLPAVLSLAFCQILRHIGWIKEDDLTLPQ